MERLVVCWVVAALSILCTAPTAAESAGYDCWIGNFNGTYTTQFIRCIADRTEDGIIESDDDIVQAMDEIHYEIRMRAERIFRDNPLLGMAGLVRSVRLYTYPYEWSWEEGNPHLLVRVNFCSKALDCAVHISRN